ncbi:EAL domain-containing protein [Marinobacter zhejiangensis]|uniref:EAL domain, c-di-GMP-specific phosphodiesterase class I (Or its enzymatically inactive variant) n=1 Tax=Marinobacter zhejiangensis TaxID=488535 RepID=A0A1I4L5Z2_9GAMM|nr:EAL domain-containing protein [Marinobacter zhejiangensis]SFL86390.1 EAL domain, c-di-GMP-specific phosphodiesterase class I (or its enzymatically inactive variant) [Marinobacter zhejiangensis]
MDFEHPSHGSLAGSRVDRLQRSITNLWRPLLLVIAAILYGLLAQSVFNTPSHAPSGAITSSTPANDIRVDYSMRDLDEILTGRLWQDDQWLHAERSGSGLGYLRHPVTFRFRIENLSERPMERLIVVPAPFLDHIAPAAIGRDGVTRMPVMGDEYPFSNRIYDLPQWVWPVTIAPQSSTLFLFEVRNSGPTMLPVSLQTPESVVGSTASTLVWKAFVSGVLGFALLLNLMIVTLLRRPGLAWLSVLMISIILSQLVLEGFGPWLLWPNYPAANGLLSVTLPLCVIAICQFTPHFIDLPRRPTWILNAVSLIALLLLVTTPIRIPYLGQGTLLIIAGAALFYILIIVTKRLHSHLYARYYALAVIAIFIGAITSSIRTVGLVPVNSVTNSAFFLGTAIASILLTMGIGQLLLEERRRRLSASIQARQEKLRRTRLKADYDQLLITHQNTGLPNRLVLEETLEEMQRRGERYNLFLVRLEYFSQIEQSLGYQAATNLLNSYLARLNDFLRDTFGEALVRFNHKGLATIDITSHAFALRTNMLPGRPAAIHKTITDWLEGSYIEGRYAFSWHPSVGVADSAIHGKSSAEVLSCAGFAALDKNQTLTEYDSDIAQQQLRKQVLMLDLENALSSGDIYLLYQPKVSVRDGKTVAFEALIRWQHREFGMVTPDQWIPLAEQVGAIYPVTLWALDRACRDWPLLAQHYGREVAVAINISAQDLSQPGFDQAVLATLQNHMVQPRNLILEITETSVMSNTDKARAMIHQLSSAGIQIALDDFGTGHSSLGTLASFDLDELKIDRSFLEDILTNPTRQRIFRTALELGDALQLNIVVEGVENEATAYWLQQFPGLYGQGYYWSRPASVKQLLESNP